MGKGGGQNSTQIVIPTLRAADYSYYGIYGLVILSQDQCNSLY